MSKSVTFSQVEMLTRAFGGQVPFAQVEMLTRASGGQVSFAQVEMLNAEVLEPSLTQACIVMKVESQSLRAALEQKDEGKNNLLSLVQESRY
ncbi:hypothetical protein F9L16_23945 [Agarivorans sp. B2Z047]|uniref:hypothetical protein n=1 Tax=Agarivorans sp. B2Z047 TaxID=2652721 RepID=UPI00128AE232|nr:hypothetical protein [Agarivorans sp. B2Z047]MPW32000.1 hypothetical protein [Agarivorans sp. B2Z047]UQN43754.1 hypothetical protein LQZ07_04595 [Agarivorans sp. B2Z047]